MTVQILISFHCFAPLQMPMYSPKCQAEWVRVNRIEEGAQLRVTRRPLDPLQRLEVMADRLQQTGCGEGLA